MSKKMKKPDSPPVSNLERLFSSDNLRNTTDPPEEHGGELDDKYLIKIPKNLVRIEYPGVVKNVDKAVVTMGGMHDIENATGGSKLELRFHPHNVYNKACSAERDLSTGVLIKLTKKPDEDDYDYEVVGATAINFKFTRACDFQYLPLVAPKVPEKEQEQDEAEYIYDKILPKKLPTLEWFKNKENADNQTYFLPANFSRVDLTRNKLYLHAGESFGNKMPEKMVNFVQSSVRKDERACRKHMSQSVDLATDNYSIPMEPGSSVMDKINKRQLYDKLNAVLKMFEDRPIWPKSAIRFKLKLTMEHTKVLLPAVSFYCSKGPWRSTWIRLGYDPKKDFTSRIYQTLDYRIRSVDGTNLKVNAKRAYNSKTKSYVAPQDVEFKSLIDNVKTKKTEGVEERDFLLQPDTIPPARQMFYQYCDIMLPEIQEMISRLPKYGLGLTCDSKNGWLPTSFTEQCREIVNKYVLKNVQNALLQDSKKYQSLISEEDPVNEAETVPTYCSKMLDNIKKGIYKSVNITSISGGSKNPETITDFVDLAGPSNEDENETVEEATNTVLDEMPQNMEETSDDDDSLDENPSDLDIDLEAVEDVNKLVAEMEGEGEDFNFPF